MTVTERDGKMNMLDFNRLIEKHIARDASPRKVGRYYPSEAGLCLRKAWYSYKQPQPPAVEKLKFFEVGNLFHHFMAEVLRSDKNPEVQLIEEEVPLKYETGGFLVSGRIDDVLLLRVADKKILVEVKSTGRLDFVEEPQHSHELQLQLYMHGAGIHEGALVYVEKNTLNSRSFLIDYDEKVVQEALARFSALHRALQEEKIPSAEARTKPGEEWQCKRCEYRERCFAD